jgi:hypothetical protein
MTTDADERSVLSRVELAWARCPAERHAESYDASLRSIKAAGMQDQDYWIRTYVCALEGHVEILRTVIREYAQTGDPTRLRAVANLLSE